MKNSHHCFAGQNTLEYRVHPGTCGVYVYSQLVFVISPLGVRVFLGSFWCNHGEKMILVEFLFARKSIQDQGFVPVKNTVGTPLCVASVAFVLGSTSM
jgi:hypothetical protein